MTRHYPERRPIPEGFALFLRDHTRVEAEKQYGACRNMIQKWVDRLSPDDRAIVQAGADERRRNVARAKPAPPPKPAKAAKPLKVKALKPARHRHVPGTQLLPEAPGGKVALAISHLRRSGYKPVFDCGKVYGKALDGVYVAGRLQLDADGLLALAATKGFDPDAWRQIA
jgi:hypothetical protein